MSIQYVLGFFGIAGALAFMGCTGSEEASSLQEKAVTEQTSSSSTQEKEMPVQASEAPQPAIPAPLDDRSCVDFLTAYGQKQTSNRVQMTTEYGDVVIELYDDVPLHRANLLYLIERNYFNPSQIIRVVPDFIIQGGNSEEVEDQRKRAIIGDHTLPAEFRNHRIHKKGAVAMSRSYIDNPKKRSAAYDFYIVIGKPLNGATLHATAMENGMNYTDAQKKLYATLGGAPHLDNEHTVFGEVVKGMDVVERISRLERDGSDWPIELVQFTLKTID